MPAKFTDVEAAAKREEILTAVAPLFADRGYENTTVADLEEATGLSRGGIFFHFPSKRELYLGAIRHTYMETAPVLRAAALAGRDVRDVMMRTFEAFLEETCAHPQYQLFMQQIRLQRGSQPDLVELYREMDALQYAYYARICVDLQERGLMNKDVDPEAAARVYASIVERLHELSRDAPPDELAEHARRAFEVLAQGVQPAQ